MHGDTIMLFHFTAGKTPQRIITTNVILFRHITFKLLRKVSFIVTCVFVVEIGGVRIPHNFFVLPVTTTYVATVLHLQQDRRMGPGSLAVTYLFRPMPRPLRGHMKFNDAASASLIGIRCTT
jgi:hypothetical protein